MPFGYQPNALPLSYGGKKPNLQAEGIEPSTFRLKGGPSTIELRLHGNHPRRDSNPRPAG